MANPRRSHWRCEDEPSDDGRKSIQRIRSNYPRCEENFCETYAPDSDEDDFDERQDSGGSDNEYHPQTFVDDLVIFDGEQ
jgi:hypothetical protein